MTHGSKLVPSMSAIAIEIVTRCFHRLLQTRGEVGRYISAMPKPDRSRYKIVPIGCLHTGFALTVDGVIKRSSPDMLSLAAYVDAVLAGADETDANLIAQAIAARAWPSFEERVAVFEVTGPWHPSVDSFE